jgi:hypothetical protein
MAEKGTQSSEFRVVLQGLKLKPDVEKRIEAQIRAVVMQELAAIDFKGDLHILPRSKFPSIFTKNGGGGGTAGIVAKVES